MFVFKLLRKKVIKTLILAFAVLVYAMPVYSQSVQNRNFPEGTTEGRTEMGESVTDTVFPNITFSATSPRDGKQVAFSVQLLILLTLLTLAPSILILMTCFLRFSIVLDFIKRALSLQQVPSTAVLNGIAVFMTIFCMFPVFKPVYEEAFKPLSNNQITLTQAVDNAMSPVRVFMNDQMADNPSYIMTFMSMAKLDQPETLEDVPTYILVPAYILHELTAAFKIGVLIYIPFIVIDMVVASILMSMGMMMLPPVQISMPFKLMLFVLVDGWGLLTNRLFESVMRNIHF